MDHASLTKAVHSRVPFIVAAFVAALGALFAYYDGLTIEPVDSVGFVAGWGSLPAINPLVQLVSALALNASIVGLILYINKTYNLLRTMTNLYATMFLVMELATPVLLVSLVPGQLMCIVVLWCVALMYMVYMGGVSDMRKVFLVFALLSGCSSFGYSYAIYIPVFILCCLQLRVFSLRCALAILFGIATPWIIFLGFGIVTVDQLCMPFEPLRLPSFSIPSVAWLCGTLIFTAFLAFGSWVQNVVKMIAYNAQSRTLLSVVTSISLVTVVVALVDMEHAYSYLSLLNCCAALQVSHLFAVVYNFSKSYIAVLSLIGIYLIVYLCNLIV